MKVQLMFGTAALLASLPVAAGASVGASAIREPINPANNIISFSNVNTGDFAFADIVSTIGFAEASMTARPGALAGHTLVSLSTGDEFASGVFSARSAGNSTRAFRLGDDFCNEIDCVPAVSLDINFIEIDFRVRAAGTVAGSAGDPRFDSYVSAINFGFALNGASRAFIGGGSKSIDKVDGIRGNIASQSGTLRVRPGEAMELLLIADLFSQAGLAAFRFSGQQSARVLSSADFAHTLEWDGVQGFRAFNSAGGQIDIGSGRFTMLDEDGNDFWFSAASFNNAVPEPASWAMMIAGFAMAGVGARRRSTAQTSSFNISQG